MTEFRQPPPGAEESVLNGILGVRPVADQMPGQGDQATAVPADQDGKGVFIPFGSPDGRHIVVRVEEIAGMATREVPGIHSLGSGMARTRGAVTDKVPGGRPACARSPAAVASGAYDRSHVPTLSAPQFSALHKRVRDDFTFRRRGTAGLPLRRAARDGLPDRICPAQPTSRRSGTADSSARRGVRS
ncbi:hypothetical protein [Streptomyces sp. NPDC090445]|uniref:hypothetical protein n=1 Tax=Streptomyces sp. NPDC090445 TaxID=3365963 RepID=UPI003823D914